MNGVAGLECLVYWPVLDPMDSRTAGPDSALRAGQRRVNKRPRVDPSRWESTALNHAGSEAFPTCCEPASNHF